MSLKKIYFGSYNNFKKDELKTKSIDALKNGNGNKIFYIVPNGALAKKYRQELIDEVYASFDLNIITFDDIVNRISFKDDRFIIGEDIKFLILQGVLRKLVKNKRLSYYRNMINKDGFIKNISSIISGLKLSLVSYEDYLLSCPDNLYYKEIGIIYKEYESFLKEHKLSDEHGKISLFLEAVKDSKNTFLDNINLVIIDEFYDFRLPELEIIKTLVNRDIDILINMPFKRNNNFDVLEETLTYLEELNFDIEYIEKKDKTYFEEISDRLFSDFKMEKMKDIEVMAAPTKRIEVKKLAEIIKKEYKKGIQLNDIAVVVGDKDNYRDLIWDIFEEEKIPTNLSEETALIKIPLVREILNILDYHIDPAKDKLINRYKSQYFPIISEDYKDKIEIVLRKNLKEKSSIEDLEKLDLEEETRKVIELSVDRLKKEKAFLVNKKGFSQYIKGIIDLFDFYKIEKNIHDIYRLNKDYDILYRDLKAIDYIRNNLDINLELESSLFKNMDIESFLELFKEFLYNNKIRLYDGNRKGVSILSMNQARGRKYKVLYMLGMTQGEYPSISTSNFFLKDDNAEILSEIGYDYKNYYNRLDKEMQNYVIAISTVENKLYISYSENSDLNESNIPSIFLDELIYLFKERDKINNISMGSLVKKNIEEVTTIDDFIIYSLNKNKKNKDELYSLYKMNPIRIEKLRNKTYCEYMRSIGGNEYSGILKDRIILEDLESIHKDKTYSISYLESYANCPYRFLFEKILKIEDFERDFEEFTNMDRGSINHEILQNVYSKFDKEIEDYIIRSIDIDEEKIKGYIRSNYIEKLEILGVDPFRSEYILKMEINSENLLNFIKMDLDRLKKLGLVLPYRFEESFGFEESFKIKTDKGNFKFKGIIDRIDKYIDEDKYIIMDYKNTEYGVKKPEDVYRGISLQMPIYMMAMEILNKPTVASYYGIIKSNKIEHIFLDKMEKKLSNRKRNGVLDQEEKEELFSYIANSVGDYIEKISNGYFPVEPEECSKYCPFRDICRIKEEVK